MPVAEDNVALLRVHKRTTSAQLLPLLGRFRQVTTDDDQTDPRRFTTKLRLAVEPSLDRNLRNICSKCIQSLRVKPTRGPADIEYLRDKMGLCLPQEREVVEHSLKRSSKPYFWEVRQRSARRREALRDKTVPQKKVTWTDFGKPQRPCIRIPGEKKHVPLRRDTASTTYRDDSRRLDSMASGRTDSVASGRRDTMASWRRDTMASRRRDTMASRRRSTLFSEGRDTVTSAVTSQSSVRGAKSIDTASTATLNTGKELGERVMSDLERKFFGAKTGVGKKEAFLKDEIKASNIESQLTIARQKRLESLERKKADKYISQLRQRLDKTEEDKGVDKWRTINILQTKETSIILDANRKSLAYTGESLSKRHQKRVSIRDSESDTSKVPLTVSRADYYRKEKLLLEEALQRTKKDSIGSLDLAEEAWETVAEEIAPFYERRAKKLQREIEVRFDRALMMQQISQRARQTQKSHAFATFLDSQADADYRLAKDVRAKLRQEKVELIRTRYKAATGGDRKEKSKTNPDPISNE